MSNMKDTLRTLVIILALSGNGSGTEWCRASLRFRTHRRRMHGNSATDPLCH